MDNRNGNSAQTSVFKIHYAKDGIHISPDYPSKKKKEDKMKYEEFKDKLETEVVLTTFEGDVIKGTLFLGDTEFDSLSGEDEVDVHSYRGGYQSVAFSNIKEIKSV